MSTQNKRTNALLQFAHLSCVGALLNRETEDAIETIEITEQPRQQQVVHRPQFAQMIFHRRAGERELHAAFQHLRRQIGFRTRIFEHLRFVKYDDVPLNFREQLLVALQQWIARNHHIGAR